MRLVILIIVSLVFSSILFLSIGYLAINHEEMGNVTIGESKAKPFLKECDLIENFNDIDAMEWSLMKYNPYDKGSEQIWLSSESMLPASFKGKSSVVDLSGREKVDLWTSMKRNHFWQLPKIIMRGFETVSLDGGGSNKTELRVIYAGNEHSVTIGGYPDQYGLQDYDSFWNIATLLGCMIRSRDFGEREAESSSNIESDLD